MLGAIDVAGAEANSTPLGRHKLDLLFSPLTTDLSKIVALLQEANITYSGSRYGEERGRRTHYQPCHDQVLHPILYGRVLAGVVRHLQA